MSVLKHINAVYNNPVVDTIDPDVAAIRRHWLRINESTFSGSSCFWILEITHCKDDSGSPSAPLGKST